MILDDNGKRIEDTIWMNDYPSTLYSRDGIYGELAYGSPNICHGLIRVKQLMWFRQDLLKDKKILVVGSGVGWEIVTLKKGGYDVTGLDLFIPDVKMVKENSVKGDMAKMPFKDKQFDILLCFEVMEHIKPEMNDIILNECKRVSNMMIFSISIGRDMPYNTHINVHSPNWWIDKFLELGFGIKHLQINPMAHFVYIVEPGIIRVHEGYHNGGIMLNVEC